MYYNGSNSFLFVNDTKIYQFKAKDSEIKKYPLCLGNVSVDYSANTMINTGLYGSVYIFVLVIVLLILNNIIDIHKYLMKKHDIK